MSGRERQRRYRERERHGVVMLTVPVNEHELARALTVLGWHAADTASRADLASAAADLLDHLVHVTRYFSSPAYRVMLKPAPNEGEKQDEGFQQGRDSVASNSTADNRRDRG